MRKRDETLLLITLTVSQDYFESTIQYKRLNFAGHEESSKKQDRNFEAKTNQDTKVFRVFKNAHLMLTFEDMGFSDVTLTLPGQEGISDSL
jgi:hypothetical protein